MSQRLPFGLTVLKLAKTKDFNLRSCDELTVTNRLSGQSFFGTLNCFLARLWIHHCTAFADLRLLS